MSSQNKQKLDTGIIGINIDDLPPFENGRFYPNPTFFPDNNPDNPLHIEIGSGKGTFLVQQAKLQPETNFLGIEYVGEYYRYAADRVRRNNLTKNVRIYHGDAVDLIRYRLQNQTCNVLHIYFPDPWPKRKHNKRRMIQDKTLGDFHNLLKPHGQIRIVTDHQEYWQWIQLHINNNSSLYTVHPFQKADSADDGEVVGTNFERKYRREGRPFNACIIKKI